MVGSGIAGMTFCRLLRQNRNTFILYENGSQSSSTVAGGLYNPVTLKRFTPVWRAAELLAHALPFYDRLQHDYAVSLHQKIPIYRKFASVEEQNAWFTASDKTLLQPYLSTTLIPNTNPQIDAPFSFGEVQHTGRIAVASWQQRFRELLRQDSLLIETTFEHEQVEITLTGIRYGDIHTKNLVFCEGVGMSRNPFFRYLPLQENKGELITLKAPLLKLKEVIKSSLFIIPLGNDFYKVGATYSWKDETLTPTPQALQTLTTEIKTLVRCPFEVVSQEAGIRPTVPDRRPLVGTHPLYKNLHLLNGLGTRGVLIAPFAAHSLYHSIERNIPLPPEMDIKRFEKMYVGD